jgi:hypothetical protein
LVARLIDTHFCALAELRRGVRWSTREPHRFETENFGRLFWLLPHIVRPRDHRQRSTRDVILR